MTLVALFYSTLSNLAGHVEDAARRVKEYAAHEFLACGVLDGFPMNENLTELYVRNSDGGSLRYADLPEDVKSYSPLLH